MRRFKAFITVVLLFWPALSHAENLSVFMGNWYGEGQVQKVQGGATRKLACRLAVVEQQEYVSRITLKCVSHLGGRTLEMDVHTDNEEKTVKAVLLKPVNVSAQDLKFAIEKDGFSLMHTTEGSMHIRKMASTLELSLASEVEGFGTLSLEPM